MATDALGVPRRFRPGAVFLGLAVLFGATDVLGLLLVVDALSGGLGSVLTGAAAAAAKRVGAAQAEGRPELPAADEDAHAPG